MDKNNCKYFVNKKMKIRVNQEAHMIKMATRYMNQMTIKYMNKLKKEISEQENYKKQIQNKRMKRKMKIM